MKKIDVKSQRISSWRPRAIGFGGLLEENEQVLRVFRQTFFFSMRKMTGYLALASAGSFLAWFFLPGEYWPIAAGIGLVGFGKALDIFYAWYRNAMLVTDLNILLLEWPKPFQRTVTRIDYWNIDEIQVEKIGIAAFFHNYGTLHFQKVNGGELISFKDVSHPHRTAALLEAFREDMVDFKQKTEEGSLKEILTGLVQSHVAGGGLQQQNSPAATPTKKTASPEKNTPPPERNKVFSWLRHQGDAKPSTPPTHGIRVEKELDDTGGIEIEL